MRNPYLENIVDYQKEHFKDFREFGFKLASEFFEKTIVWIIGLSSGTILLIFSELNKEVNNQSTLFNSITIKWTVILLIASISLGILGRILYAVAIYIGYSFLARFSLIVNAIALPSEKRQLEGNETSEYIYLLLQEDFNVDLPIILENKKNVQEEKKHLEDAKARKLYEVYSDLVISKITYGLEMSEKIRKSIFMIKKRRNCRIRLIRKFIIFLKRFVFPTKGFIWRFLTGLSFSLYILSALSFLSAIFYYVLKYYSIL